MTHKQTLIQNIKKAFAGVQLGDGIGLWEAQGHDDYATAAECAKLREKDEKTDWSRISIIDLYRCNSSISFFDAKGMRFHLPLFLLFELDVFKQEEDLLYQQGKLEAHMCPEVYFTLTFELESDYSQQRFSLLNKEKIDCVIDFLQWKIEEKEAYYKEYFLSDAADKQAYIDEIQQAIAHWQNKKS